MDKSPFFLNVGVPVSNLNTFLVYTTFRVSPICESSQIGVVDQDFNIDKIIEQNVMTNDYAPVTYDKTIENDLHNLSRTFSYTIFLIYLIVIIIIIVILIYFYYKYKFYKFCVFCVFKKEKIVDNDKLKTNQSKAEEQILLELNNLHKFTDDDIVV